MKPFKTPILILAILDLVLVLAIAGANAYDLAFPRNCQPSAPSSRFAFCITPAEIFAFSALLALVVLVLLTLVLLILSEVLGRRRARRLLDDSAGPRG